MSNTYTATKDGVELRGDCSYLAKAIGTTTNTIYYAANTNRTLHGYTIVGDPGNTHFCEYVVRRDGNVVATGNMRDVAMRLGYSQRAVKRYAKTGEEIDGLVFTREPKVFVRMEGYKEPKGIEYMVLHLRTYGFREFYMRENPTKYLDQMKALGYDLKISIIYDKGKKDGYRVTRCDI